MSDEDRPLVWLAGEIKTPPFSKSARIEAGFLLRRLQRGETLSLPQSRPMPAVGRRCQELRVPDENQSWRILFRVDRDAIIILEVFSKKSGKTPTRVIATCRDRLARYDSAAKGTS